MDFYHFRDRLNGGNIDAAKAMVTRENANTRDTWGDGVLWWFCAFGPDDPELLHHFLSFGCPLGLDLDTERRSLLHLASENENLRLMRALLDLGVPIDIKDGSGFTPLYHALMFYETKKTALFLLDAGAHVPDNCSNNPLVKEFQTTRKCARSSAVAVLCLKRCGSLVIGASNGNDVLRMIARCVWATRGQ